MSEAPGRSGPDPGDHPAGAPAAPATGAGDAGDARAARAESTTPPAASSVDQEGAPAAPGAAAPAPGALEAGASGSAPTAPAAASPPLEAPAGVAGGPETPADDAGGFVLVEAPAPTSAAPAPPASAAGEPDVAAPPRTGSPRRHGPPRRLVHARGLSVRAHGRAVLEGVDLTVVEGQVVAVLGPPGAGKTTLLRALLGLAPCAADALEVAGRDPRRDPLGVRARLGWVPAAAEPYGHMTALALGRFVGDLYPGWSQDRYVERLERFGVEPRTRARGLAPDVLARLALALALGHAPRLLLVDVPPALDARGRARLLAAVADEARGRAVVVATDAPHALDGIATHVLLLEAGRARFDGAAGDLRACARVVAAGGGDAPGAGGGAPGAGGASRRAADLSLPEGARRVRLGGRGRAVVVASAPGALAALDGRPGVAPASLEQAAEAWLAVATRPEGAPC